MKTLGREWSSLLELEIKLGKEVSWNTYSDMQISNEMGKVVPLRCHWCGEKVSGDIWKKVERAERERKKRNGELGEERLTEGERRVLWRVWREWEGIYATKEEKRMRRIDLPYSKRTKERTEKEENERNRVRQRVREEVYSLRSGERKREMKRGHARWSKSA